MDLAQAASMTAHAAKRDASTNLGQAIDALADACIYYGQALHEAEEPEVSKAIVEARVEIFKALADLTGADVDYLFNKYEGMV